MSFLATVVLLATVAPAQNPTRVVTLTGDITKMERFASQVLGNQRTIQVYLPPSYKDEPKRRFPVLYMHDGQNVFNGATSYIPNQEWRADEAAESLIRAGLVEPLIIVAIDNAGLDRGNEFLPTGVRQRNGETMGGRADQYGRMIFDEIKPMIDRTYRTKPDAANTGLCGSSFGGIITLYLGLTHPDKVRKLGVISPSIWWDDRVMLKRIAALPQKPNLKIWLDMGTKEGPMAVRDAQATRDALVSKGWKLGKDLIYVEEAFAEHNELAWSRRMDAILMTLFPARR